MSFTLFHGLRPDHRTDAARLYWAVFGSKLGRVLGPEADALRFIRRVMDETHVISALDQHGDLAGVIGYRTHEGTFVGGSWDDLAAVYGAGGALWRGVCLSTLALDAERRAMMVDGFAVREDMRGAGVGEALLTELGTEALRRGFPFLRLDVVDENLRARALYDRLGFDVIRRRHSRLTEAVFGFRSAHVMMRDLRREAPPRPRRPATRA